MENIVKSKLEKIVIPITIKSLNKLLREHWSAKGKLKRDYQLLIVNQMRLNKIRKTEVGEKWVVHIHSVRKRKLDFDNLVGGCKILSDALCEESFIWDDDEKHIVVHYTQSTEKGDGYTLITREKALSE